MKGKKILTLLLAMALVLTMFPASAWAAWNKNKTWNPMTSFETRLLNNGATKLVSATVIFCDGTTSPEVVNGNIKSDSNMVTHGLYVDTYNHILFSEQNNSGEIEDTSDLNYYVVVAKDDKGGIYVYGDDDDDDAVKYYNDEKKFSVDHVSWRGFNDGEWYAIKKYVTTTANPSAGGYVSNSSNTWTGNTGGFITSGQSTKIKANANAGYYFTGWTNGTASAETSPEITIEVGGDVTYTANFARIQATDSAGKNYSSVKDALDAVKSGTINAEYNDLTAVNGATLASGVKLQTKIGEFTAKDAAATIDVNSDGAVTLTAGKLTVSGKVTASLGGAARSFSASPGTYTVNTAASTLTVPAGTAVTDGNGVKYTGEGTFTFDENKISVSDGATVTGKSLTITGVAAAEGGSATTVSMDSTTGELALVAGKGKVTGATVKVAVKNSDGTITKTVDVTIPSGKTYTIDADAMPPAVSKLEINESVTIGGITYRVTDSDSPGTFTIGEDKLISKGDTAEIPAGKQATVALGSVAGVPTVTVPAANTGKTTIVKGGSAEPSTVTLEKSGDTFTASSEAYKSAAANTTFTIDEEGTVALSSGATTVASEKALNVVTGEKTVSVTNNGTGDITVTTNDTEPGKTSVVAPDEGSVTIGSKTYPSKAADTKLVFDKDCNVTLIAGKTGLANGLSITGTSGKLIKNTAESGESEIEVTANTPESKQDTVTVPEGGKVTIAGTEYDAGDVGATIVVSENNDKNKIIENSVKLGENESINVCDSNTTVTNTGDELIEVSAGGTVTVPAGGMLLISNDNKTANITAVTKDTTLNIDSEGKTTVGLIENGSLTVNDVTYTDSGSGEGTLTINAEGKVSAASNVKVEISETVLAKVGFEYDLIPGVPVTAAKYIYTAPEKATLGDVTIKARGAEEEGGDEADKDAEPKVLTPAIELENIDDAVEVALTEKPETLTEYAAASAKTMFAMAKGDTKTNKVELLDNKAASSSALKFTDKSAHIVNDVTYQAKEIKIENEVQAIKYTVTYGTATVDSGKKNDKDEAIMETVVRNTAKVETGSKVIATMKSRGTISIASGKVGEKEFTGGMPFTAANSSAAILIDNTEGENKISGSSSYLTEIKDDDANVTGYKVTRSSGGIVVETVVNKTEDKNAGTAAATTAAVKSETKTNTDGTKTTTATVDKTTGDKIVDKAVENKSEEVVVNTTSSSAGTVTETAAGSKTEVALPEETVQGLSKKTEASITIKADAAEVKLDKEAVRAVAEQAGSTGTVSLVVETVKQDASAVQVDLKLVTSKGNVTDFKGGNVSVTVKLNAALAAKPVVCVYIDDFKTYHKVKGEKKTDGTYTFTTGHFSSYAIIAEDEADNVIAEQNAKVEKLVGELTLKARSKKTANGNIKVTLTVNADDIKAIEDLGYTVKYKFYRSTKKAKGYKARIEGTGKTYTNTNGKKGTKYYYKARVMVYDAQGELVAKSELKQCKYACRTK